MRRLSAVCLVTWLITGCSGSGGSSQAPPSAGSTPTATAPAPSSTPPLATPSGPSPDKASFKFTRIASGLQNPLYVTGAADSSGRLFVVEQIGRIRIVKNGALLPTPFLDIRSLVALSGSERGLLSIAFHPQFKTNGVFFVDYTRASKTASEVGDTVIARYTVSPPDADVASAASGQSLLIINQPQSNHNGGLVKFGPDGLLYVGLGDGGSRADTGAGHAPQGNGQSLATLLGKILRIGVGATGPYTIPATNPKLGAGARPEIWVYGLRNPWRFSFDRATGDLYIGDVGQDAWEEIDYQAAGFAGGANYGWPVWEATHRFRSGPAPAGDVKPIAEYPHSNGQCSVTGGYVYRGARIPALSGFYLFGDYCTGRIWTLVSFGGRWRMSQVRDTAYQISSFGEDDAGELYVVDLKGAVYRFDPA